MKLLILLVVVVGLVALVQLARVYRLTATLRTQREEDISEADNRLNGGAYLAFMFAFYASFIYLCWEYGDYLPPSASAHGVEVDALMGFNLIIIIAVFFVVNTLLFWFSAKYYYREDRKATFFVHDNRLEVVWPVIPSIVLAVIIAYGLRTWNQITGPASPDALRVEVYSKQFDWTVRYPGNDGEFGASNYNLITPTNPLGIMTADGVEEALSLLGSKISDITQELMFERGHILDEIKAISEELLEAAHGNHGHDAHGSHDEHADHDEHHDDPSEYQAALRARLAELDHMLLSEHVSVLSHASYDAKDDKLHRLKRHRTRITEEGAFDFTNGLSSWSTGADDKIVKGEFHLPIGREVEFLFRSRDVLHSAYMPHFRAQMNTVPGVPTRFKMTPIISTDSMRTILNDPEFDYILLCNKVCGAAHFNMTMKIIIESEEGFEAWLETQKEFIVEETPASL